MATYTFTGSEPRIMFGLSEGVNAWTTPADGEPSRLVDGQTVVLHPGDTVKTDKDFDHAELALVTEASPAKPSTTTPKGQRND